MRGMQEKEVRQNIKSFWWLPLLVAIIFFIIDRLIKWLVIYNSPVEIFFLPVSPFINQYGPFSLPVASRVWLILAGLAFIGLVYFFYLAWRQGAWGKVWGLSLILIGGFSNLWDRFNLGGVIDVWYGDLFWGGFNFNLADVYLVIGVIILIYKWRQPKTPFHDDVK